MKNIFKYMNIKYILLLFMLQVLLFSSCKKDDLSDSDSFYHEPKRVMNSIMNEFYLWNDEVPALNPDNYTDPAALLDALRYKELDKWSYIASYKEHLQWYTSGQYAGLGIGFGYHTDNTIRIMFVYDDSPLKAKGVKRGWEVRKINGTGIIPGQTNINALLGPNEEGVSTTIEFKTNEDEIKTVTAEKKIITTNSVLYADTLNLGSKIVGHMVYKSFISPSVQEINSAFALFKEAGISDLIVDLRYNGGGDLNVAQHLGSMIIGTKGKNKVYYHFSHNNNISEANDTSVNFDDLPEALDINRVIFLTSQNSASASEVLINGLKPHMEVRVVGDRTHGKPVGMYGWDKPFKNYDLIFVPVCFKLVNSLGEGDYFDGIPADYNAADDLTKDFSDRDEAMLQTALALIKGEPMLQKSTIQQPQYPERHGLDFEISAF